MEYTLLLQHVLDHAGLRSEEEARAVSENVVTHLGALLTPHDRLAMAGLLPGSLAGALNQEEPHQAFLLDDLVLRVAIGAGVPVGAALEQTQVVCEGLARAMSEDVTDFLRARLPDDVAALLRVDRPTMRGPARYVHPREAPVAVRGSTLATGRPGSNHPVTEAAFGQGHSGSVARSDNPHADRKLSSGSPSRKGRGSTLGAGRPGPSRPVSEYDEP